MSDDFNTPEAIMYRVREEARRNHRTTKEELAVLIEAGLSQGLHELGRPIWKEVEEAISPISAWLAGVHHRFDVPRKITGAARRALAKIVDRARRRS